MESYRRLPSVDRVLADERLYWMTGNVIGVDGGEDITLVMG